MDNKKILVTGGCGFIGSNFIRHMLETYPNYEIINLDKLTYAGNLSNLKNVENDTNYTFIQGDICSKNTVDYLMKQCDYVIHFAAESHVDRSINDSSIFIKTNVLGTHILLESALKHNIKRFIHISTDEVYGSISEGSFKETDKLNPSSPYAASKASSDLIAQSYYITHNLPVIITRCVNNYGPYQHPEKLIPLFITNLLEGKLLPIYGDGLNIREWIYVIDHCNAIDFLLHNGTDGEIYNIGSKKEKTAIGIANMITRLFWFQHSKVEYVEDRLGHDLRYSLDCSKINNLGWSTNYFFDEMLEDTINWYNENKWWWAKLKQ